MRHGLKAMLSLSIVAAAASGANAASIAVTNIPTSTTDFGYLSSA